MIKNHINLNNKKKRPVAIMAAAITVMLVVSVGTIGTAPLSVQQQDPERGPPGLRITSENIVDGEVTNADLADDAIRVLIGGDSQFHRVAAGQQEKQILECLPPQFPLGGGYTLDDTRLIVTRSMIFQNSYEFIVYNPTTSELGYNVAITCARLAT